MTIAMCRSGTLSLEIECGRKPREQRVCRPCDYGEVEDVAHLFRCQKYQQIQHDMHNNNNSIIEFLSSNTHLKSIANLRDSIND